MHEICPNIFIIDPDIRTEPKNENDIFYPDGFKVLQAENLTKINDIISITTTGQKLYVRLLCCYRMKDSPETYCIHRHVDETEKRICSEETGIKNIFTHFHIQGKFKELHCNEYFLAFIEGSDFNNNAEILVNELLNSVVWLGIKSTEVFLNVFTFGEPIFGTSNQSHLEELINSARSKKTHEHIECKITHIKQCDDFILISLRNNYLFFNPSSREENI